MFKPFETQLVKINQFFVGDSVTTVYDLCNQHGVLLRDSRCKITQVKMTGGVHGILYDLEDTDGDMFTDVPEAMLRSGKTDKKRGFLGAVKQFVKKS